MYDARQKKNKKQKLKNMKNFSRFVGIYIHSKLHENHRTGLILHNDSQIYITTKRVFPPMSK